MLITPSPLYLAHSSNTEQTPHVLLGATRGLLCSHQAFSVCFGACGAHRTRIGGIIVPRVPPLSGGRPAQNLFVKGVLMNLALYLWNDDSGQDIPEYAVMLAVILVIVVGTIRLVGSNANNVFSSVASSVQ